jgi:aspartate aminotransferase
MEMRQKYQELSSSGKKIIDLSIGDTDFGVPASFKTEIYKALENGKTHYTLSRGIHELRQNIAERYGVSSKEVLVIAGGKEGIFSLFLASINPGDEVIFPVPSWPAYGAYLTLCDAKPKMVDTTIEENFEPSIAILREVVSKKTKMIVFNSPNNPTGAVYSPKVMKAAAELADENDFLFLSDEIYSNYDYSGTFVSALEMGENVVVLDGFSKTFGMTGLRLCYLIGNKELIDSVNKIHAYNAGNASSIIQYASVGLFHEKVVMQKNKNEMRRRNELAYNILKNVPGLKVNKPKGAFYSFPRYEAGQQSVEMCKEILLEQGVGLVPGAVFNAEKHFRIAYSQPKDILKEGLERIRAYFEGKNEYKPERGQCT